MTDDLDTRWHAVNAEMNRCPACSSFTKAFAAIAEIGQQLLSMEEWFAAREPLDQAETRHRSAEHPDWRTCYEERTRREEAERV
jgi:hypothetical protein